MNKAQLEDKKIQSVIDRLTYEIITLPEDDHDPNLEGWNCGLKRSIKLLKDILCIKN